MSTRAKAVALLLCIVPAAASAQTPPELASRVGTAAIDVERPLAEVGLSTTEAAAVLANMRSLADLLLAQPALRPPRGVVVDGSVQPISPAGMSIPAPRGSPVRSRGFVYFHPYRVFSGRVEPLTPTPYNIMVDVNCPEISRLGRLHGYEWTDAQGRTIFLEPWIRGEVAGRPIHWLDDAHAMLLFGPSDRSPWVPLTVAEFLRVSMRIMEKELAEMGPMGADPANPYRQRLENHRRALATWPAARLQAQAIYLPNDDPLQPDLLPSDSREGRRLIVANPDWYDPTLPRTATQLLTFGFTLGSLFDPFSGPAADDDIATVRIWDVLRTTDWNAVAALVGQ
jgi:hypothetical protein